MIKLAFYKKVIHWTKKRMLNLKLIQRKVILSNIGPGTSKIVPFSEISVIRQKLNREE